jgi:predicted deacetylase
MMPVPAQYLLRFDDLCPTLLQSRWEQFESLICEFNIRPILALVPDNMDRDLMCEAPDRVFWERMRALEAAGGVIGLHGYRHICQSHGRSLVPLHRGSEFAGVPEETQRTWIRAGFEILRAHGLNPRVFVAPRHGFDQGTLRALSEGGVEVISDGFARIPFVRDGITWIPQQLWAPLEKTRGLWTICIHSNTASDASLVDLRTFLERHAGQFTSLDRVLSEWSPSSLSWRERLSGAIMLGRVRLSRLRKGRRRTIEENS